MSEYKFLSLEQSDIAIIDGDRGKNYPKQEDFVEKGFCLFLNTKNVREDGFDFSNAQFISKAKDDSLRKGKLQRDDIVLTTRGTLGNIGFYNQSISYNHIRINSGMVILRCGKNIYPKFIYLFLKSSIFKNQVQSFQSGSAQPQLPIKDLKCILIPDLLLSEQKQIAAVLSCLDNKIDNLRRQNETLEKIAQTLFKHWFIDFEFPNDDGKPYKSSGGAMVASELGDIPEGWRVESLEQEIKIQKGLSYKGAGLSDEKSGIPMHNLKSVYEGGGYQHEGIKFYNSDYKKHHICYARDLIVPNTEQGEKHKLIGFPARIPSYFKDVSILTHHLFLIRPLNTSYLTNEYIYYLLYSHLLRKQILGYTNGTTVNMLSPDGLKKPIFPKPPQELISNFSQVIKPVWDKFENNIQQIQTLTKTRDALLPKLMSGQIRIKEVESLIEKVK